MPQKRVETKIKIRLFTGGLCILLFLFLSIFFLIKILKSTTVHQLYYSENSNLNYNVCLKPNEYFKEQCLDEDKQYIANIIDYIPVEFKYNLIASDYFNYQYRYYITAKIIATEKDNTDKILFSKEDIILPEKKHTQNNSNTFTIKEDLNLDYDLYNDLMTAFRKDYTLTLNSKVIITLHVNLKGKYDGIKEEVKLKQEIKLAIPLSEQTIGITMDYNDINNFKLLTDYQIINSTNIIFYILEFICIFGLLFVSYIFTRFMFKVNKLKSAYEKKLKKILKEYDQIIVETKTLTIPKKQIIEVKSFNELIDAHYSLNKPILFKEVNNQKAIFIIKGGNETFQYILKDETKKK